MLPVSPFQPLDCCEHISPDFYKNRNCLVTGGAGMIGSYLVRALKHLGARVRTVDNLWRGTLANLMDEGTPVINLSSDFTEGDLRSYSTCLLAMHHMDTVFHLADVVAGIAYVFGNQDSLFRNNILINSNCVTAAKEMGVGRFLYVGTACSYPKELQLGFQGQPLVEEQAYPANPESSYGWSKLMGEYEAELVQKASSMQVGILRLHNVYGPFCDLSPERSQVIPSLIRKAIRYPAEEFIVWGSGSQTRAFVFVGDVVRALLLAAEKGMNCGTIQIGMEERVAIADLAGKIVRISGKKIPVKMDTTKPDGDAGRSGNCAKANRILEWQATTGLEQGLTTTYQWIEQQINKQS